MIQSPTNYPQIILMRILFCWPILMASILATAGAAGKAAQSLQSQSQSERPSKIAPITSKIASITSVQSMMLSGLAGAMLLAGDASLRRAYGVPAYASGAYVPGSSYPGLSSVLINYSQNHYPPLVTASAAPSAERTAHSLGSQTKRAA